MTTRNVGLTRIAAESPRPFHLNIRLRCGKSNHRTKWMFQPTKILPIEIKSGYEYSLKLDGCFHSYAHQGRNIVEAWIEFRFVGYGNRNISIYSRKNSIMSGKFIQFIQVWKGLSGIFTFKTHCIHELKQKQFIQEMNIFWVNYLDSDEYFCIYFQISDCIRDFEEWKMLEAIKSFQFWI